MVQVQRSEEDQQDHHYNRAEHDHHLRGLRVCKSVIHVVGWPEGAAVWSSPEEFVASCPYAASTRRPFARVQAVYGGVRAL